MIIVISEILVVFTSNNVIVVLAISLSIFIHISQFLKESFLTITYTFVLADVGNQLEVGPNAKEADAVQQ